MRKIIAANINRNLLVSTLMLFTLFGCNSEKIEGYKFYDNDANGLSIIYPPDWEARSQSFSDQEDAVGPVVVFQPVPGNSTSAHITVFTENLPDSVKTADDYFNYSKGMLISQGLKVDITNNGQTEINGRNAHWVVLDYQQMQRDTKSLTYMFVVNGKGYNVSSVTNTASFDKLKPIFEKVSKSVKFN